MKSNGPTIKTSTPLLPAWKDTGEFDGLPNNKCGNSKSIVQPNNTALASRTVEVKLPETRPNQPTKQPKETVLVHNSPKAIPLTPVKLKVPKTKLTERKGFWVGMGLATLGISAIVRGIVKTYQTHKMITKGIKFLKDNIEKIPFTPKEFKNFAKEGSYPSAKEAALYFTAKKIKDTTETDKKINDLKNSVVNQLAHDKKHSQKTNFQILYTPYEKEED